MRLVYIHQHFVTGDGFGPNRSYDVSRYLVRMGHEVIMICGIYWQSGLEKMPWWRLFRVQWIDGIKVVVCNVPYHNKMRVPARMWAFLKFMILATVASLWQRKVDLVFATSTPTTVGVPGRVSATLKRVPYVFEVRDLWPEDLLAADRIKPGFEYKVWEWLESFSYKTARKILLVSRGFHDRLLERGFPPQMLETIVLGADGALFADLKPNHDYIREHGLDGKTIAVYAGSISDANGLYQVIDAAEYLRDRPDIAIVLIGDGRSRAGLEAKATEKGLTNVYFLDPLPKKDLVHVMAACHIGLMILKPIRRPRWVTPNKIFDYMFTGIPSVVNYAGTTAELVEQEDVGLAAEPHSAEDLAAKIIYWADHPEQRASVGRHARRTAMSKYDRTIIAQRLSDVFQQCLQP
ncbi:MAG: glycosyltransferase family 4 protein [Phycisphaerales bacterium]|nr:MAG: glycosyltransferase family 4 protein [Phycisphaerales bacterium]